VTGATAGFLFASTLFGSPLGFYSFNPAVYLGAGVASGNFNVRGDSDWLYFIIVRLFGSAAMTVACYYLARLTIKLSESAAFSYAIRPAAASPNASSDYATAVDDAPGATNMNASVGRSLGLRNRTVANELRVPLNVAY
jgi:hypothetical protein